MQIEGAKKADLWQSGGMLTDERAGAELFTAAAMRAVDYLNANTPLADWSVSRVADGEQIHLHVHHEALIDAGDRVEWTETFCSRMAVGAAHVVRDSLADPEYADLALAQRVGAYAGFPIIDDTGAMFGVLCGVNPAPLSASAMVDEPLVELISELLSSQLALARRVDRERRARVLAEAFAQTDSLTGLMNRRGWDLVVRDAQERIDAFGDAVAVAVFDLNKLKQANDRDGHVAGDDLLRRAGRALDAASAPGDRVARYGGDEFVVLANGVPAGALAAHFGAFETALAAVGVSASFGYAATIPAVTGIAEAFELADAAMYEHKRQRHSG